MSIDTSTVTRYVLIELTLPELLNPEELTDTFIQKFSTTPPADLQAAGLALKATQVYPGDFVGEEPDSREMVEQKLEWLELEQRQNALMADELARQTAEIKARLDEMGA